MIIIKSNGSDKGKSAFTFELDALDLAQLAINIQGGDWRASIREVDTEEFLGSLEFRTMQFRPFAGRKEKFDAIEVGKSISAYIVPGWGEATFIDQ